MLVLTKPLGSGVLTTAIKADLISPAARDAVYAHMATLNKKAGNAVRSAKNVHACTDVTGFACSVTAMRWQAAAALPSACTAQRSP